MNKERALFALILSMVVLFTLIVFFNEFGVTRVSVENNFGHVLASTQGESEFCFYNDYDEYWVYIVTGDGTLHTHLMSMQYSVEDVIFLLINDSSGEVMLREGQIYGPSTVFGFPIFRYIGESGSGNCFELLN